MFVQRTCQTVGRPTGVKIGININKSHLAVALGCFFCHLIQTGIHISAGNLIGVAAENVVFSYNRHRAIKPCPATQTTGSQCAKLRSLRVNLGFIDMHTNGCVILGRICNQGFKIFLAAGLGVNVCKTGVCRVVSLALVSLVHHNLGESIQSQAHLFHLIQCIQEGILHTACLVNGNGGKGTGNGTLVGISLGRHIVTQCNCTVLIVYFIIIVSICGNGNLCPISAGNHIVIQTTHHKFVGPNSRYCFIAVLHGMEHKFRAGFVRATVYNTCQLVIVHNRQGGILMVRHCRTCG